MQEVSAPSAESVRLVFHSDDNTPVEFIVSLLQTVLAKSEREAQHIVAQLNEQGVSACGPYPAAVAMALLDECERRIGETGHPQRVPSEEASETPDETHDETFAFAYACEALNWHFPDIPTTALVTRLRQFPFHMQADVQVAIDRLLSSPVGFFGIHEEDCNELGFAQLMREGRSALALAPPNISMWSRAGEMSKKRLVAPFSGIRRYR